MKSNLLNIVSLNDPISSIYGKRKVPKAVELLQAAGIETLQDLIWIFPLKIQRYPLVDSFDKAIEGELFKGIGKIISFKSHPLYGRRGRNRALLHNISIVVSDLYKPQTGRTMKLQWFNAYNSSVNKIKNLDQIIFHGMVNVFAGQKQIVAPNVMGYDQEEISPFEEGEQSLLIKYPTVNGIQTINKIINKIPKNFWDNIKETIPESITQKHNFLTLSESFKIVHGIDCPDWNRELYDQALNRLIYEEFYHEQLKVLARKLRYKKKNAPIIQHNEKSLDEILGIFPYSLTDDQLAVVRDLESDFRSGNPMMRLLQGDVGCGKTTVALIAALIATRNNKQVALMCPTESLALQHYNNISKTLSSSLLHRINVELLLGSNTAKEKKHISSKLEDGSIDIVIGTHSLFQDSVQFKDLGLAIIDEQHKFGVAQRLKLVGKGEGTHCLIMTATPIPRSLSLTQYGDLDVSIIKTIPAGRKGTKTRIVSPENFNNFLNFIKTRLDLHEQVYIVAPAIEEGEDPEKCNFQNVENIFKRFQQFFPNHRIFPLHGRMDSSEKEIIFNKFTNHEIDILVSTSVIEVGIDVHNATIMAIMNPERFGLSSLHQLRGRVGRGGKPGFCFLVTEGSMSPEAMERLKILETTTDGFKIAESDLQMRGQGDLFGTNQSGIGNKKIANIVIHHDILINSVNDLKEMYQNRNSKVIEIIKDYQNEMMVSATI